MATNKDIDGGAPPAKLELVPVRPLVLNSIKAMGMEMEMEMGMGMGTDITIDVGPLGLAKKVLEATPKPNGRARGSAVPISIGLLSPGTDKVMGSVIKVQGTG